MKRTFLTGTAVLASALLASASLSAQEKEKEKAVSTSVNVGAIVQLWYTQMLSNNNRLNDAVKYYQVPEGAKENTLHVRRAHIYLSGTITEDLKWNVMFDPSANIDAKTTPNNLYDAYLTLNLGNGFSLRMGQYKPLQTFEATLQGAGDIFFYDRSQLARRIGDKRDRGITATYAFGDSKGFNGKMNVGMFLGNSDLIGGRAGDLNAQKDVVTRLEMSYGKEHRFGFYTRDGVTDQEDKGQLGAYTFSGVGTPTSAQVLENKDKTTNRGVYYAFENSTWIAQAEAVTGILGRRYPSVIAPAAAGSAKRQHLDQKFLGYQASVGYKITPKHWVLARYDVMDYNSGSDWYTAYNPYTQTTGGVATGVDTTPKFTDIILGYTYLFNPAKYKLGQFKLNYIRRPNNWLLPRAGQTGEQGGDSLVAAIQVGF